ncbi:MAG: SIR2 family protein [Bryobacteraceae bacterium]
MVIQQTCWEETVGVQQEVAFPGRAFPRLWFDSQGRMIAAGEAAGPQTGDSAPASAGIEWKALAADGTEWAAGGLLAGPPPGAPWSMDRDATGLAWLDTDRLCSVPTAGGSPTCVALPPADAPVRGVLARAKGGIGVVRGNGEIQDWAPNRTPAWTRQTLTVKAVDQIAQSPETLAVYSRADRALAVYRLDQGSGDPKLVETRPLSKEPTGLLITAPGQVAVSGPGAVQWLSQTLTTPGAVARATATPMGSLLAIGAFGGLRELRDGAENRILVDTPDPLTAVAIADSRVAYSGPTGTALVRLIRGQALSRRGSILMRVASFLASLSVILGLFGSVLGVFANSKRLSKHKKLSTPGPGQLPFPKPEMIAALGARGGVLWAGAGLSAQSGLPLWHDFLSKLIESAFYENWIPSADGSRLNEKARSGHLDEAANEMIRRAKPNRNDLISYYESVFDRYAPLSDSHRFLTRLPLVGAITTCYDQQLDSIGADEVILDHNGHRLIECEQNGEFFLIKLYGDPRRKANILLSREEFQLGCREKPDLRAAIGALMAKRSLLFVGASLQGLIDDLTALGAPPSAGGQIHHFAITGVRGDWEPQAEQLRRRWGIEVFACDIDQIAAELPRFLEKMGDLHAASQSAAAIQGDLNGEDETDTDFLDDVFLPTKEEEPDNGPSISF